jgi:hypothetical protein
MSGGSGLLLGMIHGSLAQVIAGACSLGSGVRSAAWPERGSLARLEAAWRKGLQVHTACHEWEKLGARGSRSMQLGMSGRSLP